jgi:hypothetical protein
MNQNPKEMKADFALIEGEILTRQMDLTWKNAQNCGFSFRSRSEVVSA